MASLRSFRINSKAAEEGEWVSPGPDFDDLELKLRALGDEYTDARNARMRKVAIKHQGDERRIPIAISRSILIDCLDEFVILDVRGLVDEAGEKVSREQFVALLRNPDFAELVTAVLRAVGQVGMVKDEDAKAAAGNSGKPSARP